jgi:hypothetical protein
VKPFPKPAPLENTFFSYKAPAISSCKNSGSAAQLAGRTEHMNSLVVNTMEKRDIKEK